MGTRGSADDFVTF